MSLQEDKENFCNAVRAEVKAAGLLDSPGNCWAFFIEKVWLPLSAGLAQSVASLLKNFFYYLPPENGY